MLKRVSINLLILVVSLSVSFLVFEYTVRLVFPHFDPSGHLKLREAPDGVPLLDGLGLVRQVKNTGDFDVEVVVSVLGLREEKDIHTAGPDDYFVVGDSFALGWGVPVAARFSNQLEDKWPGHKVFNISVPTDLNGYEKLLEYAKHNGANIRHLIVSVCMENDLREYGTFASAATLPADSPSSFLTSMKVYLTEHSASYFLVTNLIHSNPVLREIGIKAGFIVPNLEAPHLFALDPSVVAPSVERLADLVQSYPDATILIVPSRGLWTGTASQRAASAEIHDRFVALLRARNLRTVDPRPEMEASGDPLSYHFKNDGHWNPSGHALAAQLLAEALRGH